MLVFRVYIHITIFILMYRFLEMVFDEGFGKIILISHIYTYIHRPVFRFTYMSMYAYIYL